MPSEKNDKERSHVSFENKLRVRYYPPMIGKKNIYFIFLTFKLHLLGQKHSIENSKSPFNQKLSFLQIILNEDTKCFNGEIRALQQYEDYHEPKR
jgi:hypothetical protein